MVDWPKLRGEYVIIQGGVANFAGMDSVTLHAAGAFVNLMPPWQEREDLRYLLKNCAGIGEPQFCAMDVAGYVGSESLAGNPVLKQVDFPNMAQ